jgi:hypothetical protein
MSYQGQKPFGRRRTDKPLSEEERRQLQIIRRDVDEDSSGQIRRYLRLASRVLDTQNGEAETESPVTNHPDSSNRERRDRAA